MRVINKKKIFLIIFIILLNLVLAGCFTESNSNSGNDNNNNEEYGENFSFTLLNGLQKQMSDYQGKVVILDFMGANCQPCQLQMFVLKDVYKAFKNDIEIISIDVWVISGETVDTMHQFIQAFADNGYDLDWTFGLDDKSGTLYFKYASNGVPMLYILDKNGNIYYSKAGYTEYSVLAEKINNII